MVDLPEYKPDFEQYSAHNLADNFQTLEPCAQAKTLLSHRTQSALFRPWQFSCPLTICVLILFAVGMRRAGQELLQQLLNYDPAQRITAKKALQNDFFSSVQERYKTAAGVTAT